MQQNKLKTKIAVVGLGTMGRVVLEQASKNERLKVVSTIDPVNPQAEFKQISANTLQKAEVAVCFTHPASVLQTIAKISSSQTKIVMATTGWESDLAAAKQLIKKHNSGLIFAANFSLGVLLYFELVKQAGRLFEKFKDYDVAGLEMHHFRKVDAPSGTLKKIGQLVLENMPRKTKTVTGSLGRALKPHELHLGFARGGDVAGVHKLVFDSVFDNITITHQAKTRQGFALGALLAAEWIKNKSGWFSEQDLIQTWFT